MADIRLLTFSTTGSAKGLVLGNKQGFYRDLGADIFNNNDFVRVVVYYTVNLNSAPNSSTGATSPEYVTNYLPSDYFYFGLKTPNVNFPDAAEVQSKFCGFYMPPRGSINTLAPEGSLSFLGWSGSPYNNWGKGVYAQIGDGLFVGNLTTPYTNNHILSTQMSTLNRVNHITNNSSGGVYIGALGLELRKNNTLIVDYSTSSDVGILDLKTPSLSAMSSYLNNRPFLSNSVSLASSAPYGQATAIFMYNPLNTTCIRVHGMVAAGFKY